MTATNMCLNFVGKWYSLPLKKDLAVYLYLCCTCAQHNRHPDVKMPYFFKGNWPTGRKKVVKKRMK